MRYLIIRAIGSFLASCWSVLPYAFSNGNSVTAGSPPPPDHSISPVAGAAGRAAPALGLNRGVHQLPNCN